MKSLVYLIFSLFTVSALSALPEEAVKEAVTYAIDETVAIDDKVNRVVLKNINGECEVYNKDNGQTESCTEEDINLLNNFDQNMVSYIEKPTAQDFNNQSIIPYEEESLICSYANQVALLLSSGVGLATTFLPLVIFVKELVGAGFWSGVVLSGGLMGFGIAIIGGTVIILTYKYIAVPFMNNMCDIKISY